LEKKLLTVAETAVVLGLGRSMTYSLTMSGALRSITIGSARRIPVEAIDEFIRAQFDKEDGDRLPKTIRKLVEE
jgi:excisionase family DNA binding protein